MINLHRKKLSEKDNFSYLLGSLIFLFFFSACVEQFFTRSSLGQALVMSLTVLTMTIAIWSMRSSRYAFNTGISLVISVIISALVIILDQTELAFLHLLSMLLFFLITLKLAAQQVLFASEINKNQIIRSICIFLLLGLIWVMLYLLLAEFSSNAFSGLSGKYWQDNFPSLIYFSFVTLTTLGFGDLLPLSPLARFLVYLEVIVGVFYMAIMVSSLVAISLNNHPKMKT